jgi:hypothetical protein
MRGVALEATMLWRAPFSMPWFAVHLHATPSNQITSSVRSISQSARTNTVFTLWLGTWTSCYN